MPERTRQPRPPSGVSRLFFRVPILLFKIGLGGVFRNRMLLLNHIGRKSGLQRRAVLEVIHYDKVTGTYVVNAGFGPNSHWYQNLSVNPDASIQVGRKVIAIRAEKISAEKGAELFLEFARAHPLEARFVGLLGYKVDGSDADWRAVGEKLLFIALRPR